MDSEDEVNKEEEGIGKVSKYAGKRVLNQLRKMGWIVSV